MGPLFRDLGPNSYFHQVGHYCFATYVCRQDLRSKILLPLGSSHNMLLHVKTIKYSEFRAIDISIKRVWVTNSRIRKTIFFVEICHCSYSLSVLSHCFFHYSYTLGMIMVYRHHQELVQLCCQRWWLVCLRAVLLSHCLQSVQQEQQQEAFY